jgi:N-acetylglutamate synthase-like GNAT family acetyltransferase
MTLDCKVRPAQAADAGAVARLITQLGYPVAAEVMAARLRRIARSPERETLVAELEGRVVGMLGLESCASYTLDAPAGRLMAIVVDEDLRGQGIGRRLVDAAHALLAARGVLSVNLTSRTERKAAHRFWSAQGYARSGLRFARSLEAGPEKPAGSAS